MGRHGCFSQHRRPQILCWWIGASSGSRRPRMFPCCAGRSKPCSASLKKRTNRERKAYPTIPDDRTQPIAAEMAGGELWKSAAVSATGASDDKPARSKKEYTVIYKRGKNNWSAYVPDLPGCIANGKTRKKDCGVFQEAY